MLRRSVGALLAPARSSIRAFASWPTPNLAAADPEAYKIIKAEEARQKDGITLIPSENYASTAVLQALGSCLTNKYSEGYPGARYYGGNEQIDNMERCHPCTPRAFELFCRDFFRICDEFLQCARWNFSALIRAICSLCHARALKVFGLDAAKWGVNVQTLSGSPANFAGTTRWHSAQPSPAFFYHLCSVHRSPQALRSHHVTGLTRWRSSVPRLPGIASCRHHPALPFTFPLADPGQENLGGFSLFRDAALPSRPRHWVHQLREDGGIGCELLLGQFFCGDAYAFCSRL